jgi:hypothetical protein
MTAPRSTSYADDALIGHGADLEPRPDEQAAAVRLLHTCGADDLAECLGVAS